MSKYLFSLMIMVISISSFSQSGYLGKTVYIDYMTGVSLNPGENSYNRYSDDFLSLYGLTHELSIHKIYSRKNEIAPFFNYHRTSFGYDDISKKMYVSTYGVNFRFYFKSHDSWNTAPVGNYFDLKPFVSVMKLTKKPIDESEEEPLLRLMRPGLAFGFGRQRVVQDVLLLNYGIQFSLPLSGINRSRLTSLGSDYVLAASFRNFIKTVFQVRVGIGFLAH